MATVHIRKVGAFERSAHTLLLLAAASLLITINVMALRLYPTVHASSVKAEALIDFSSRTMVDVKKLVKDADDTENAQAGYLKQWNAKVSLALDNANGALVSLNTAVQHFTADEDALTKAAATGLGSANDATVALTADAGALQTAIGQFGAAAESINGLAQDQDLKRAMKGTADLSEQAAGIAGDTHKVTSHFEQEIDSPKPKTLRQKLSIAWEIVWQLAMLAK
ncbi:MAG TPA: hypothetical protein VGF88_23720 [Acidobacteriaceae bacterium]|jgi:hypothetical protein